MVVQTYTCTSVLNMVLVTYRYGARGVNAEDFGMGPAADHQSCMQHAVHLHIIHICGLPRHLPHQPRQLVLEMQATDWCGVANESLAASLLAIIVLWCPALHNGLKQVWPGYTQQQLTMSLKLACYMPSSTPGANAQDMLLARAAIDMSEQGMPGPASGTAWLHTLTIADILIMCC